MPKQEYKRVTFTFEGKRYERAGKTLSEAHEKAAELKAALRRGEVGISGAMTVKRWAEEWLETYKGPSIGDGQYANYRLHIDHVIIPAIGSYKLRDVKDVHLQKILNSRAGKSQSDLSKLRNTLRAIFKQAYISRLIMHTPAENLTVPASENGTHRSITDLERKMILKLAATHKAGLWVMLSLYCGIRPGEARALNWQHVDLEKKLLHVEVAMKAHTTKIGKPKSAAGIRDIPIPNHFIPILAAQIGDPFTPVLLHTSGRRHTKSTMDSLWRSFVLDLDILMGAKFEKVKAKDDKMRTRKIMSVVAPDLSPYCLRHTYCTDLQDAGVPINVARYLMGHASIVMTSRIYTHTTEKVIQDAADKINKLA